MAIGPGTDLIGKPGAHDEYRRSSGKSTPANQSINVAAIMRSITRRARTAKRLTAAYAAKEPLIEAEPTRSAHTRIAARRGPIIKYWALLS